MKKTTSIFVICAAIAGAVTLAACLGRAQNKSLSTNEMNSETITLVAPAETGATLLQALQKRASTREYTTDGLTLEQLSGVMWAAAGENRPGRLTAPSASARYPIRTYAVLANGIYLYDAPTHTLTRVAEGDHRNTAGMQDFVYTAPLNIVYVADFAAYEGNYSSMPEADQLRISSMDAMGYCQNANLWACANGMASVTRLMAPGPEFLKAIGAPETCRFVLAQTVGIPAAK
jgi:outer membrane murein-binding lipoprotein Lpp